MLKRASYLCHRLIGYKFVIYCDFYESRHYLVDPIDNPTDAPPFLVPVKQTFSVSFNSQISVFPGLKLLVDILAMLAVGVACDFGSYIINQMANQLHAFDACH